MSFDMIVQIIAWTMLTILFIVYICSLYPKGLLKIQMDIDKDIRTCEDYIRYTNLLKYKNLFSFQINTKVKIEGSKSTGVIIDKFKYKDKFVYAVTQQYKKVDNLKYLKVVWYYEDQLEIY